MSPGAAEVRTTSERRTRFRRQPLVKSMAGQGRPTPIDAPAARARRRWPLSLRAMALLSGLLAAMPAAPATAADGALDVTLRFQWTCQASTEIDGEIIASQGQFDDPQNLSMDAGTTGGFWLRDDRRSLRIRPRGAPQRLGLQMRYRGDREGPILLRLMLRGEAEAASPAGEAGKAVEISLNPEELCKGDWEQRIAPGVELHISRAPSDALRLRLGASDATVFSTSESVPLRVTASAIGSSQARNLELRMELRRDGDSSKSPQWERKIALEPDAVAALTSSPAAVEIDAGALEMPASEGVYTLVARLAPSGGSSLVDRLSHPELFVAAEPIAQRSVQFVVLAPTPPPTDPKPMSEVARLRPLDRNWIGVGSVNAISGKPLGRETYDGREVAALAPGDWLAQPIPISEPGKPHVVVVRYPADRPLKIGVSIRQPDAAGASSPLGVDTGVVDEPGTTSFDFQTTASGGTASGEAGGGRAAEARWGQHRVVFWPRSRQAVVVVTNADSRQSVRIESIAVEAGPARLGGGVTDAKSGRMAAIYLDKPLMPDAFGCDRAIDSQGPAALEDWTTFLQAGLRLVDYVQASGANAAVVTVASEGATLYPTGVFAATPRYDRGIFFSDGRDPVRKDVLELLLRLFDRAGLRLIAGVELATPLPALEAALEDPEAAVGLEWRDAVGRRYVEGRPPRHGLAPYYNPLDGRTEKQIAAVVDELVARYAHHRSLSGVGLHLGPQTYMQLPSAQWGRDARTLERIRGDWSAGSTASPPPSGTAINAWLDGDGAQWHSQWRQRQLGELFERLAARTAERPLLLLTADFVSPTDGEGGDAHGLDWRRLATRPGVMPMRLIREQLLIEPAHRIVDAKMNEDFGWDALLGETSPGASTPAPLVEPASESVAGSLLFRPPTEHKVTLHAGVLPWDRSGKTLTLFTHAVPGGDAYRMRLARLLDSVDARVIAVGGWTPSVGQEAVGRSFLTTFGQLPVGAFRSVPPEDDAARVVRVRQYRGADGLYVYAVNTAPWAMRVRIATNAAAGTPVRRLGAASQVAVAGQPASDPQQWEVGSRFAGSGGAAPAGGATTTWAGELAPGELVAFRVAGPAGEVVAWSGSPASANRVAEQLAVQVEDLSARVAILGRPREFPCLQNGGFESGTEERIDGWLRAQHPAGCVRFTSDGAQGKRAIVLRNEARPGARTWLLSESLPTPETGRIAVSFRARSLAGAARVRVAVEGRVREMALRRSVEIDLPAGGEWPQEAIWLKVSDLPDGEVEELRLAIDLITPGEIALDDIRLYDFYLTDRERSELQRQTFVAVERMRRGDFSAAARLLDSHWARYLRWLRVPQALAGHGTSEDAGASPKGGSADQPNVNRRGRDSEETAPGTAHWLRDWLPSPLRF